jgi:predicted Zn finger-like uncharacterized protein
LDDVGDNRVTADILRSLWGRIMATGKPSFHCPNCNALYQVVKSEAGPETVDREITCRSCGGPFPRREGKFILTYFCLRKAGRIQGGRSRS